MTDALFFFKILYRTIMILFISQSFIPKLPVQRRYQENKDHACIPEVNYYLSVYNVYFKLTLCTE